MACGGIGQYELRDDEIRRPPVKLQEGRFRITSLSFDEIARILLEQRPNALAKNRVRIDNKNFTFLHRWKV